MYLFIIYWRQKIDIHFRLALAHYVVQEGLKLAQIFLPHTPLCWDDRHRPLCLANFVFRLGSHPHHVSLCICKCPEKKSQTQSTLWPHVFWIRDAQLEGENDVLVSKK